MIGWLLVILISTPCAILALSHRSKYSSLQIKLATVTDERRKQELEFTAMEKQLQEAHKDEVPDEERHRLVLREDLINRRYTQLQERVQRESHREVLRKYGPGPHRVQFDVTIPTDGEYDFNRVDSFVVEMARIELMPHSVHFFLEQVTHRLWDGCTFILNAHHILQAGPHTKDQDLDKRPNFVTLDLDKLSFQEFSPLVQHEQYTLGFAGRPAGPDFYINKIDNSETHGPWGQAHHVLGEEADPCFGRVILGMEVLTRIFALEGKGSHGILTNRVVIKQAKYIAELDQAQGQQAVA